MSAAIIKENHLETDLQQFQFGDELPVVAAYARCATVSQDGGNNSIEVQLQSIRHMCNEKFRENEYHLIAIVDAGYSGNLPWNKPGIKKDKYRPGLTLVTKLIENGLVKYLAARDMCRLARSLRVLLEFQEDYLIPYSIELLSAEGPFVTGSETSELVSILQLVAEFQLSCIRQASLDGQKARANQGYTLGKPPYGWAYEKRRNVSERRRVGIEPVAEQAEVVRRMFDLLMSGKGAGCVARQLTDAGIPSPESSPRWSPAAVRRIMLNPIHAGLLRHDGELVRGAHHDMRIIDEAVYRAAVCRLTSCSTENGRNGSKGVKGNE